MHTHNWQRWCIGFVYSMALPVAWAQADSVPAHALDPEYIGAGSDHLDVRLQEIMEAYTPTPKHDLPELFPAQQSDSAAMDGMQTAGAWEDYWSCFWDTFVWHTRDCNSIRQRAEQEDRDREDQRRREEQWRQEAARQEAARQEAARQEAARQEAARLVEVARKARADADADRDRSKRLTWREIR